MVVAKDESVGVMDEEGGFATLYSGAAGSMGLLRLCVTHSCSERSEKRE
jgi:hypothetical protein